MGMSTQREHGAWTAEPRVTNKSLAEKRADAGTTRVCCGRAIEPRLAQARDSSGSRLFVTVWHCPQCGRLTY